MEVDGEAAEAVVEVLHRYGHQGVAIEQRYADDEGLPGDPPPSGPLTVRAYLPDDHEAPAKQREIERAIYFLGKLYPIPEPRFTVIDEEDWAEAWKSNYHPIRIGRHLLIKPAWLDASVGLEDVLIEMDPGMAFGSGTHPSTQLCLEAVEDFCRAGDRVLDLGCGSGILAIAAARLGAHDVLALDNDGMAVQVARQNIRANHVTDRVHAEQGSLETIMAAPRRFDLVLVNILAGVIVEMCQQGLGHVVRPGGRLVAAGIIEDQAQDVVPALEESGLRVEQRRQTHDWTALVARRPPGAGQ